METDEQKTPRANASVSLNRKYAVSNFQGTVVARIQTMTFASMTVTSNKHPPVRHDTIVRTPIVWIDRIRIRVAVQTKDQYGSPETLGPFSVSMRIDDSSNGLTGTGSCLSQIGFAGNKYAMYCYLTTSPPGNWFPLGGVADVTTELRIGGNIVSTVVDSNAVQFITPPTWYNSMYRSDGEQNDRPPPSGYDPVTDLIFATLQVSPIYGDESFDVFIYTSTLTFPVNAWRIELRYDTTKLDYVSYSSSGKFQTPLVDSSTTGVTIFSAGILCGTGCNQAQLDEVTGDVIYLAKVTLQPKTGQPIGIINTEMYPYANEIIN